MDARSHQKTSVQDFLTMVSDAYNGLPRAAQVAIETVRAHYVASAARNGETEYNPLTFRKSVTAVVGAVVDFNGAKTVAPTGWDADDFHGWVRGIDAQYLEALGSALIPEGSGGARRISQLIRSTGRFQLDGKGGYFVEVDNPRAPGGRGFVLGRDSGGPLSFTPGVIPFRIEPESNRIDLAAIGKEPGQLGP